MSKQNDINDQDLLKLIASLKNVPIRDYEIAYIKRNKFIEKIKQPVPVSWLSRLKRTNQSRGSGKSLVIINVFYLLFIFIFGTSVTAYASENANINDPLYSTKLFFENIEIFLETDFEDDFSLHVEFAQNRLDEINSIRNLSTSSDLVKAVQNFHSHLNFANQITQNNNRSEENILSVAALTKEYELLILEVESLEKAEKIYKDELNDDNLKDYESPQQFETSTLELSETQDLTKTYIPEESVDAQETPEPKGTEDIKLDKTEEYGDENKYSTEDASGTEEQDEENSDKSEDPTETQIPNKTEDPDETENPEELEDPDEAEDPDED
jgi:hypothetical protein